MNQWQTYLTWVLRTCPILEPLVNETNYFAHHAGKLIHCLVQFFWARTFLESGELVGQNLDAFCEAFHRFMRFFLVLKMLPISSVISFISKTEGSPWEPTLYAAPIQENTVSAIGFTCFESDNEHPCFSSMIYRANSLSNFNTHFNTIACRSKMAQNGLELVQLVHYALDLCIQRTQVTVMSLWLKFSRESSCWKQFSTYLSDNTELQSWDCIYLEVCWGILSPSEAIETNINSHFVSFWDSATKCLHRSSNLMLTRHKRSPSETLPNVMIFFRRDSL